MLKDTNLQTNCELGNRVGKFYALLHAGDNSTYLQQAKFNDIAPPPGILVDGKSVGGGRISLQSCCVAYVTSARRQSERAERGAALHVQRRARVQRALLAAVDRATDAGMILLQSRPTHRADR